METGKETHMKLKSVAYSTDVEEERRKYAPWGYVKSVLQCHGPDNRW